MSNKRNGIRSVVALAALSRNSAGAMKHRLQPRGGSQREDFDEEIIDDSYEPMWFDLDREAAEG